MIMYVSWLLPTILTDEFCVFVLCNDAWSQKGHSAFILTDQLESQH